MAVMTVDSESIVADKRTFEYWADTLWSLWNNGLAQLHIDDGIVGWAGHLSDFSVEFSDALSKLSNFVTGGDIPGDPGGVGSLECFAYVLGQTTGLYNQGSDQADECVAQLQRELAS